MGGRRSGRRPDSKLPVCGLSQPRDLFIQYKPGPILEGLTQCPLPPSLPHWSVSTSNPRGTKPPGGSLDSKGKSLIGPKRTVGWPEGTASLGRREPGVPWLPQAEDTRAEGPKAHSPSFMVSRTPCTVTSQQTPLYTLLLCESSSHEVTYAPISQDEETEEGEVVTKVTEQTSSGAGSHSQLLNKWGDHPEGPLSCHPWAHRSKLLSLDHSHPLQVPHSPPALPSPHS